MTIAEIHSKTEWEHFLAEASPHSFLHSWNWGEVQEKLGTKVIRLGLYEDQSLIAVALILLIKARRGSFLFCPHGPVVENKENIKPVLTTLLPELEKRGKELGCVFIRVSPLFKKNSEYEAIFRELGFRNAPVHLMHPELAWILNIDESEEAILKNMRKTTRYLVRRGEKEGVKIRIGETKEDLENFLKVYRTTVDRQNFTPFKGDFFKTELEVFKKDNQVKLFLAEYDGKVITAAMIVFYGQSAFYHHGASDQTYSHIPGAYLLQWQVIREAKARGLQFYNFWGIVPPEEKKHPWAGLSLFKTGFGGYSEVYLHAQDYLLSQKYWLVYFIETLRRKKRRL
ncbi:MAG: peptidoglycan bridge formation glycyltransferase FemA/FemB family protein [Patescibacteria group bacterium]